MLPFAKANKSAWSIFCNSGKVWLQSWSLQRHSQCYQFRFCWWKAPNRDTPQACWPKAPRKAGFILVCCMSYGANIVTVNESCILLLPCQCFLTFHISQGLCCVLVAMPVFLTACKHENWLILATWNIWAKKSKAIPLAEAGSKL